MTGARRRAAWIVAGLLACGPEVAVRARLEGQVFQGMSLATAIAPVGPDVDVDAWPALAERFDLAVNAWDLAGAEAALTTMPRGSARDTSASTKHGRSCPSQARRFAQTRAPCGT